MLEGPNSVAKDNSQELEVGQRDLFPFCISVAQYIIVVAAIDPSTETPSRNARGVVQQWSNRQRRGRDLSQPRATPWVNNSASIVER